MAEGLDPAPVLREINDLAKKARVPVRYVARRALEAEARTDGPQGVPAGLLVYVSGSSCRYVSASSVDARSAYLLPMSNRLA